MCRSLCTLHPSGSATWRLPLRRSACTTTDAESVMRASTPSSRSAFTALGQMVSPAPTSRMLLARSTTSPGGDLLLSGAQTSGSITKSTL